ncbi:MAG: hypothetical protein RIE53_00190 [Rhodothermales bacterium]
MSEETTPRTPEDPVAATDLENFAIAISKQHSGPLPDPWTIQEYKKIDPKLLQWVLTAAEEERIHRQWCEKEPLIQSQHGQKYAFALALSSILVGAVLAFLDKNVVGLATMFAPLALVLGVFAYKEVRRVRSQHDRRRDSPAERP